MEVKCNICGQGIEGNCAVCSKCKTPYHIECFNYDQDGQQGCATYSCGSKQCAEKDITDVIKEQKECVDLTTVCPKAKSLAQLCDAKSDKRQSGTIKRRKRKHQAYAAPVRDSTIQFCVTTYPDGTVERSVQANNIDVHFCDEYGVIRESYLCSRDGAQTDGYDEDDYEGEDAEPELTDKQKVELLARALIREMEKNRKTRRRHR